MRENELMLKHQITPLFRERTPLEILEDLCEGRAAIRNRIIVPRIAGGSSTPAFASTPNTGSGIVSATLDTSLTAPTNVTTIFTAGASGSKVDQVQCQGLGTTSAGNVNLFLFRSATYYLIDQFPITVVTSSTTAVAFYLAHTYENLQLLNGDSLRVTNTVAGNQSLIQCTAFGGDY
jgi:hypothetical protein